MCFSERISNTGWPGLMNFGKRVFLLLAVGVDNLDRLPHHIDQWMQHHKARPVGDEI